MCFDAKTVVPEAVAKIGLVQQFPGNQQSRCETANNCQGAMQRFQ